MASPDAPLPRTGWTTPGLTSREESIRRDMFGGAPKHFSYKAGKKETQQHANARALLAAMDYRNRWIAQYNQDNPNAPYKSYAADNEWLRPKGPTGPIHIAGDTSFWSPPKGKKAAAPINEGTYKSQLPKPSAADSEEKAKLIKLRNEYSIANQAVTELKQQQKENKAPTPEKKKEKGIGGFLHKQILTPLSHGYAATAGKVLGRDVVMPTVRFAGRLGGAGENAWLYGQEHDFMPGQRGGTKDPRKNPDYKNWTPDEQKNAVAAYEKIRKEVTRVPLWTGIKKGLSGKGAEVGGQGNYWNLSQLARTGKLSTASKITNTVTGGVFEAGTDPINFVLPGVESGTGRVLKTLAKGIDEGSLAQKAASVSTTFADRLAEEERVAAMEDARRAGDKTFKLRDIQKANKALDATRAKTSASITRELIQEGFTPAEIATLNLNKSLTARTLDAFGKTSTAMSARKYAKQLLEDVHYGKKKLDPSMIDTHAARLENILRQEPRVQSAANDLADARIAMVRARSPLEAGGLQREKIIKDSLGDIVGPQTDELRKILTEASQRRFAIKGLDKIPGVSGALRGAYMPFQLAGSGPSSIPELQTAMRALHIPYKYIAGKGLRGTSLGEDFLKRFSMGAHFPGEAERVRQITESSGIADAADQGRRVDQIFKGFSKSQKEEILRARDEGRVLDNPAMEAARVKAKELSDEIFQKLQDAGIYKPEDYVDNYVHHQYTHGKPEDIKSYKAARKAAIKRGQQGPTLADAAQFGDTKAQRFKPIDTIDAMLKSQYRDASRKLTRVNYRLGTISRYGVLTDDSAMAARQGLEAVEESKLTPLLRKQAQVEGAKWYLPKEIHKSWKSMDELMGALGEPAGAMQRTADKIMHVFKSQATIYSPGNWVNNTLGDITMNYIDGVRDPSHYSKALSMLRLSNQEAPKTVRLGGEALDANKVLYDFKHSSPSGGFIRTEGGKVGDSRFVRGVTNGYETREETSRLAHFMSAINEEMLALKKAGAPADKIYDYAVERAARRVAKYNIDYTAITPFERKLRRNFIPFYTYTRKAAPLMAEAMATHPGRFVQMNRYQGVLGQLLQGGPTDKEWQPIDAPEYAQQAGMLRLNSSDQPWYLRNTTPPFVLNRIFGGTGVPTDPLRNVANMMGPFVKMPVEAVYHRSLFSGQPITNWQNWLISQSPWASQGARLTGNPLSVGKTKTPKAALAQTVLNVFGIPVSKLTYNQQEQKVHRDIAKQGFTKTKKEINKALAPFTIKPVHSKVHGNYWTIVYGADAKGTGGKVVEEGRYRDWNQAVQEAWRRRNNPNVTSTGHEPGWQKPKIPPGYSYKMLGGKMVLVGPGPSG